MTISLVDPRVSRDGIGLCPQHADATTPPMGWTMNDLRSEHRAPLAPVHPIGPQTGEILESPQDPVRLRPASRGEQSLFRRTAPPDRPHSGRDRADTAPSEGAASAPTSRPARRHDGQAVGGHRDDEGDGSEPAEHTDPLRFSVSRRLADLDVSVGSDRSAGRRAAQDPAVREPVAARFDVEPGEARPVPDPTGAAVPTAAGHILHGRPTRRRDRVDDPVETRRGRGAADDEATAIGNTGTSDTAGGGTGSGNTAGGGTGTNDTAAGTDDDKFPWHHHFDDEDEPAQLKAKSPLLSRAFRSSVG
ncbi:MAG: hypothetical protein ACK5RL_12315 [Acidimicrobiales bacterium]